MVVAKRLEAQLHHMLSVNTIDVKNVEIKIKNVKKRKKT